MNKAATFVFLLAVSVVVMRAQSTASSTDVTIQLSGDTAEYCLGEILSPPLGGPKRGPDDITLRLSLKSQYENHRPETIILPSWINDLTRMTVTGQSASTILGNMRNGGLDVNMVMAMSSPHPPFTIIAGGKSAWYTGLEERVVIPVLDRSSGVDLRGKTVQIVMTRDFRSLAPDVVDKLNEKWKDYGTIWTGVAESNTLTFRIPDEPPTRNCVTLVAL
jgi:hypothetical protein